MNSYGRFSLYAVLALFGTFVFAQNYKPGEVIVKLKSNKGAMSSYAFLGKAQSEKQMTLKASFGKMNLHYFALGKGQTVDQAIQELSQDPDVEYVEPNYYVGKTDDGAGFVEAFSKSEIEAYAQQSHEVLSTDSDIGLLNTWQSMGGYQAQAAAPVIAVIDTGLQTSHEVIQQTNALWVNTKEIPGNGIDDDGNGYIDDVNGWNFVTHSGSIYDDDGHGTHVTGIILSVDQDIFQPNRVASKVKIMPLKFLDGNGQGTTSDAIQAIYYAVNNGATVLNNSWGGSSYSAALHDAVAYSYSKGVAFVAAAGNSGTNNDAAPLYPAGYDVPNVIAVAASGSSNYLASFSNYGEHTVHLASPGTYILSTYPPNTYATMSGTSMATPFVAGTLGQMKVVSPNMLGYQLKNVLLDEVQGYGQLAGRVITGGKLATDAAIAAASKATVESSQPSYKVSYLANRSLASTNKMAGCGLVSKLEEGAGPGEPLGRSLMQILITLSLLALPLVVYQARRVLLPQSRRRHDRYKIDSEVRITVGDREMVGSVSSISLGGAQVNTAALLEDGGLITMSIESPDGSERVEVGGRVVWSEANKAYGVAFDQAPQSVLHRITDWTRGLQKT
jgi:subtilisin family serine protease